MSYQVAWTSTFKKDYKRAIKQHRPIEKLDDIIRALSRGEALKDQNRDHALTGSWIGFRECHIEPDWLLIYRKDKSVLVLTLVRTGSHSDLFSK